MPKLKTLLMLEGRLSRLQYAGYFLLLNLLLLVLSALSFFTLFYYDFVVWIAPILSLAFVYLGSNMALAVQRLHDLGLSGWWSIPAWIPGLNFVVAGMLMMPAGNVGDNEYGPQP